jgi:hypothetical protein
VISIGFIIYETILFGYSVGEMTSNSQLSVSYALLALIGILIMITFLWIVYRFIKYFRR